MRNNETKLKNRIGIFLLIGLNGSALFLNIMIAVFSFGIIVMGYYTLEEATHVIIRILKWFVIFGLLSFILNFFILKYLNQSRKPLITSALISITCFMLSLPFVYIERNEFLKNGKENTLELEVKHIQVVYVKNLKSGKLTFYNKEVRETIWEIEYLMNYPNTSKGKFDYEVHIKFKMGELIFLTNELPVKESRAF